MIGEGFSMIWQVTKVCCSCCFCELSIRNGESCSGAKATAKAAADRYEALQHGIWKPGTDQTITLLHGYVPPGMPPQQAAMLYNALPKNARIPVMAQPMTPDRIAAMAGEPIDHFGDQLPEMLSQQRLAWVVHWVAGHPLSVQV